MSLGTLAAIFIADSAGGATTPIEEARLVPERGIDGDRYFAGVGSFSRWPGSGRDITLIEQEVIDAVLREHGVDLRAGQSRRNLVTLGVRLADLNGQFFRIGGALLHGARECAPCGHLERLVPGSFEALKGRGGLRAEIVEEGNIRNGDAIILGREKISPALMHP
jgi:MOSC domain-containing protein YiiM